MNRPAITIHPTSWQQHQADLIKIRTDVFMLEQHVSAADEWDGLDEHAIHFIVQSPTGLVVGCARLLSESSSGDNFYHIGRVAILKSFRNQGIGHQLMKFVIAYCRHISLHNIIYLHAQIERRHFYETLGFIAEGDEFMDAGIPHICMRLA
jgi:predicted GNAT family N-acyltransferase